MSRKCFDYVVDQIPSCISNHASMTKTNYKLQCYVAGAPKCFLVNINPTETSSHLLELIIENDDNPLPDYRADDLEIFKVRRSRTSCGR